MFRHPHQRSKLDLMGIRFLEGGGEGGGEPGGDGGEGGGQSTYTPPATQADLDRIIESRIARVKAGYADYDELKNAETELEQLRESQKTADEKALDAARAEATTDVTQRFLSKLVTTEAKAVAATLGFNDPADALQVIDVSKLPVKDDEPDTDAIKKAVEELAKSKPYLVKADAPKPRQRPKPPAGESDDEDTAGKGGKGKAAAALRQLAASRKSA